MIKILSANMYRLKKSKCFWIILGISFLLGGYIYINYNGLHPERCVNCDNQLGSVLFQFLSNGWFILPIFTNIFMIPLYSNGIIKNMVIIGHKRSNIYIANLITINIVNLLFSCSFILGTLLVGTILVPDITTPLNKLLFLIFDSILLSISYASLFNFIGMIFDKIASVSVSFTTVIWGLITCSNIMGKYSGCTNTFLRNIYEFILCSIPIGQSYLINDAADNYKVLWIYSLVFIIIINYLGLFIIKKKKLN